MRFDQSIKNVFRCKGEKAASKSTKKTFTINKDKELNGLIFFFSERSRTSLPRQPLS